MSDRFPAADSRAAVVLARHRVGERKWAWPRLGHLEQPISGQREMDAATEARS
jgi:hypothetical protein